MVEEGTNGVLTPERDPTALADAIERLLGNPEEARTLGNRGREIAGERFSIQTSARQLQQLFETI
jgi:glycosyltransferase involved in cell wall biosynthesis